jgi:diguanylate cyclase (GGDEF)-like protein/putative nucleotidyltransferase with HDIG domain
MNVPMTRTLWGFPERLALYIVVVTAVALPLVAAALAEIASDPPSPRASGAVLLFFVFALAADLRPVPMDREAKSEVSIANVFAVACAILFGWRYAVPLASVSAAISLAVARRGAARISFNFSMYALSAGAASLPVVVLGSAAADSVRLSVYVLVGGALHLVANGLLVSGAISLSEGIPYRKVIIPGIRFGGPAFAIMALLAALAANLWVMNPWLIVLLAGPLFTLTLYQRSALHSQIATHDARTDNLTGLGNHRAYQAALRARIEESRRTGEPFSLCLVDVDNFKQVNDTHGHPVGDDVLARLGALLETIDHGEAFRFAGDEFAILVSLDEMGVVREVEQAQQRFAHSDQLHAEPETISVGIATFPNHATDVDELQLRADSALYWAKSQGKNRTCLYSPTAVRTLSPQELGLDTERRVRLHAAKNLVRFVDARDASTATHSKVVSSIAGAIGIELGLLREEVEHLRLAGLLHDIGKIALPDAILRAPRPLDDDEYAVAKKHAEFGHALLEGMGIEPVNDWVLHHHEHWDGSGYPSGLAGEAIPLGARIVLAADAFEAMTTGRPYRDAVSVEEALDILYRNAGSQFDLDVVRALDRHLAETAPRLLAGALT